MKRNRRVKILATLGPASSDEAMIRKLHEAGADVFRINMSHTDHDSMRELVARIRRVEAAVDRPIGILADLQGPSCASASSPKARWISSPATSSRSTTTRSRATPPASTCPIPKSWRPSSRAIAC